MSATEQKKTENSGGEGLLTTAAKAIGSAAGKVASIAGVHDDSVVQKTKAQGKLPKKNKARTPRRVKKAQKRAHNVA